MSHPATLLFSYGTLQDPNIQLEIFHRRLTGRPDSLSGYTLHKLTNESPYYNLQPGVPTSSVSGTLYELAHDELALADEYERDAGYLRIQVTLQSGAVAWVYLAPSAVP